jgi:hypothetical protein
MRLNKIVLIEDLDARQPLNVVLGFPLSRCFAQAPAVGHRIQYDEAAALIQQTPQETPHHPSLA